MPTLARRTLPTPAGPLTLVATGTALVGATFAAQPCPETDVPETPGPHPVLDAAAREFAAYGAGRRTPFTIPVAPAGTAFQREVWAVLGRIPHGETRTYGWVAAQVGRPAAVRAVGAAIGRNPIGVVIPCHRVVGADGALTGYAGGLDAKRRLLAHERDAGMPAPSGRPDPKGADPNEPPAPGGGRAAAGSRRTATRERAAAAAEAAPADGASEGADRGGSPRNGRARGPAAD